MKLASAVLVTFAFALTSASAIAARQLTQAECHDYPFVPLKHEVTHKQLIQELSELEAVGYQPSADDDSYPDQLDIAEAALHREYRQDCIQAHVAAAPTTHAPSVN